MSETGIEIRHSKRCPSRAGGECPNDARRGCKPTYQAHLWNARRKVRERKTFPTVTAARAWRQLAQAEIRKGTRSTPSSTTVRQAAEEWLAAAERGEARARGGKPFKPSAVRSYRTSLEARVYPELGARRLSDVTLPELQAFVDRLVATPRDKARPEQGTIDASTVRNTIVPLRSLYRHALKRGLVSVNPCSGLDLPAVEGKRDRIASPDEARALLAALEAWPSTRHDGALWATAFYAGLRRGELQALRWDDVDLEDNTIRVERSWDTEAGDVEPKSASGKRTVPVPGVLRRYLAAHKLQARPDAVLVFGRANGTPFTPSNVRKRALTAWRRATREALTPIGLHEARHTYASLMIAAGVNIKAVSTYMGHASVSITWDRYGHLMPGNEAAAAGLLDRYLLRALEV